jgi:hypothetical protein
MRYTVVWSKSARNKLANLWINAPDRTAVTQAADRIDVLLADDPDQQGYPFGDRRVLYVMPLAVIYTVSPDDRLVEVLQVERVSQ